jgi:hypothetical protein
MSKRKIATDEMERGSAPKRNKPDLCSNDVKRADMLQILQFLDDRNIHADDCYYVMALNNSISERPKDWSDWLQSGAMRTWMFQNIGDRPNSVYSETELNRRTLWLDQSAYDNLTYAIRRMLWFNESETAAVRGTQKIKELVREWIWWFDHNHELSGLDATTMVYGDFIRKVGEDIAHRLLISAMAKDHTLQLRVITNLTIRVAEDEEYLDEFRQRFPHIYASVKKTNLSVTA